jgi:hypothetical protein
MNDHINHIIKEQVEKAWRTENRSKIAVPFVPYVGPCYSKASKKVLIVGKATDGWGWKGEDWNKESTLDDVDICSSSWFEELATTAERFIEKKIIPFYSNNAGYNCDNRGYNSLFWNRTYRILSNLLTGHPLKSYERRADLAKTAFRSFAWTNVFKIAPKRGNPPKKLRETQFDYNTLRHEIEHLKPDVVLFFTAPGYDGILKKVLPTISIDSKKIARVAGLGKEDFGGIALRTYHPQYWKFDMQEVVTRIRAEATPI